MAMYSLPVTILYQPYEAMCPMVMPCRPVPASLSPGSSFVRGTRLLPIPQSADRQFQMMQSRRNRPGLKTRLD